MSISASIGLHGENVAFRSLLYFALYLDYPKYLTYSSLDIIAQSQEKIDYTNLNENPQT